METTILREPLWSVLTKYYSGEQIKTEMGGACSTYGRMRIAYKIFVERREGRNHLEDPGIDGKMELK